uniref:Uncharacterized protein n=1 Tax=Globodera rostochiensis TaxID=31243 RepID=A0A914GZC6_GLORO
MTETLWVHFGLFFQLLLVRPVPPQQQQQHQQKMFDGVQTTAAAAVAGTPTATTTTDPQDSFITTLCSCTHQQQQQIRPSRKEETKSDRTRRIRVSTSLPNCALSREPKAEAEQHQNDVTAPEPVSSASVLNCSHKQQQQQQKGRGGRGCVVGAVEKAKSRGPPEQRQQHNHHTPQHMAVSWHCSRDGGVSARHHRVGWSFSFLILTVIENF